MRLYSKSSKTGQITRSFPKVSLHIQLIYEECKEDDLKKFKELLFHLIDDHHFITTKSSSEIGIGQNGKDVVIKLVRDYWIEN